MDAMLKSAQAVIESSLMDQEVANKCPSLTPEDIHMIRQSQTDLKLLPYAAIQELSELGEQERQQTVLLSPLRIKEFKLFKERLIRQFDRFTAFQEQQFNSDESHMDDMIVADIMNKIQQDVFANEDQLLKYFIQYTEALTGTEIDQSFV